MAVYLASRAKHLLIIPLNSGKSVYLAPGESSPPIADMEINANAKVAKLLKKNLIQTTKHAPAGTSKEKPIREQSARAGTTKMAGEESGKAAKPQAEPGKASKKSSKKR